MRRVFGAAFAAAMLCAGSAKAFVIEGILGTDSTIQVTPINSVMSEIYYPFFESGPGETTFIILELGGNILADKSAFYLSYSTGDYLYTAKGWETLNGDSGTITTTGGAIWGPGEFFFEGAVPKGWPWLPSYPVIGSVAQVSSYPGGWGAIDLYVDNSALGKPFTLYDESVVPDTSQWLLTILGVAATGIALRRRTRISYGLRRK